MNRTGLYMYVICETLPLIERENMYLHFSDLDIVLYFLAVWCCEYNLKWQPGHAISILIDGPEGPSKKVTPFQIFLLTFLDS